MSALHSESTHNHVLHSWSYANTAARTGATGFVAADVGKVALQLDTTELYLLTATTPTWTKLLTSSGAIALDDVTDVNAPSPTNGQVLTWDSTPGEWVAATPTTAPQNLDDLGDVNAPTPSDNDVLTWDADTSKWISAAPGAASLALDDLSDVNAPTPSDNDVLSWDNGTSKWVPVAPSGGTVTKVLTLGVAGTLAVAAGGMRLYVPWACTITNVRAAVGTAPTGASIIVDVNKNGTTIFSTQANRPTITATNYTDLSNTPDVTAIAQNDYITVDVDAVGSTIAGSNLVVQIEVTVP